jgi:predicted Zn-ribbon and HTH transcriptional regulator
MRDYDIGSDRDSCASAASDYTACDEHLAILRNTCQRSIVNVLLHLSSCKTCVRTTDETSKLKYEDRCNVCKPDWRVLVDFPPR